jgi:hypothetical protein
MEEHLIISGYFAFIIFFARPFPFCLGFMSNKHSIGVENHLGRTTEIPLASFSHEDVCAPRTYTAEGQVV